MTDEDDWLPLPPEAQCAHPGELAALGKRAEPVDAPRTALPPAPSRPVAGFTSSPNSRGAAQAEAAAAPVSPPAPPDAPEVLQALAALRAKLHAAPAPQSFVAAMQDRERREERRRHRSRRAAAAAPANEPAPEAPDVVVAPWPASEAAPSPVEPPGPAAPTTGSEPLDHDHREDSAWFRALPEVEQQRLHTVWAGKRANTARTAANVARNGNERLVAAILVFLAVMVLGTGVNWHATVGAGVVCGIWWRHALADRFLDPMRAGLCMLVLQGLAMVLNGVASPQLFFDAPLLVSFAALVGFDGEMRRTGGFDVR